MQVSLEGPDQSPFNHHVKTVSMIFSARVSAAFLLFLVIIYPDEGANGDFNGNCKTKVRDMLLKYCANNGVKKRDVFQLDSESSDRRDSGRPLRALEKRQISPEAAAALAGIAAPIISEILRGNSREYRGQEIARPTWDQGYSEKDRSPDAASYPGYSGFGFPPPISGDDLGMGMTANELDELYEEIVARLPRAAKNKDQTYRLITDYAARCCNENLSNDDCSDPAGVVNCP